MINLSLLEDLFLYRKKKLPDKFNYRGALFYDVGKRICTILYIFSLTAYRYCERLQRTNPAIFCPEPSREFGTISGRR